MSSKQFSLSLMVFLFFTILTAREPVSAAKIPAPSGDIYVQDNAHILNQQQRSQLQSIGRQLEDETTAQLAVLTVDSIGSEPIEDYANKAYRTYGLGTKKADNGVLLVVAMSQKKIRIEVGYGLEGAIPDGKAGRILDENAIPYLKRGKPELAVTQTYQAIAKEIKQEYKGQGNGPPSEEKKKDPFSWFYIIIIALVIFLDVKFFNGFLTYMILSIISRGGGGGGRRGGGGGSSGGGGAGRGW
ncbi:TPM domain-containing protein [Fictibacillus terranigra]|uniref:TPM domain-containing protein n=1 Tax=Fictibacillus terranigra TaxID=3058424 RepID=A0ABT8E4G4_9BACL|nr:TPM domain-containing protein [Fictibacillus sp. CENA-BCM004]MDN4072801.1 TPM domain-containing protein [Fictibacillus sp. CENA-BCM004]